MKLLFVDDSPTVCAIYSALLKDAGYEVLIANNKSEALELAQQHLPKMAIIDFFMPNGNGDELTQELLSNPLTSSTVVAIHSQFPDVVEKALAAGAVEMIGKDDPHELFLMRVAALRRLVDGLAFQCEMIGSVRHEMREQQDRPVQILMVDDSPTVRAVYGSLLKGQGYEVLEADTLASGEEMAKKHLPQLMVIDYMLPDGHGDELIRRLLGNQETSDILMVMFSQRQDVEEKALGAGAIDLFYKDDPTEVFLRRIASLKRYINAQQMQRRIEQEVLSQENEMQMRVHDLERIKREKQFVDRLISSIPIGLLVIGSGRVVTANRWFEHLFGVMPTENYSFLSLQEQLKLPLQQVERAEYAVGREVHTEAGQLLRIHCFGIDLDEGENEDDVVLWMFEDITQLRQAEEQQQFAAFQSGLVEMSATILHNIGNALTAVSGSLWRMEEGMDQLNKVESALKVASTELNGWLLEQQETAQEVDGRVSHAGKILDVAMNKVFREAVSEMGEGALKSMKVSVNHISEIIQVQQGAARPESQAVACDMAKVIDDVLVMQKAVLQRSEIEVTCSVERGIGIPHLPRNQLLQAVNNLIKNSFEAISEQRQQQPEMQAKIEVSIQGAKLKTEESGGAIALSVRYNGMGMSEKQLEKVLQFGYTTKETGSGFGLHATANFIEGLGGAVEIESDGQGQGSRVTLVIPLHPSKKGKTRRVK
ncbi:MAG: response regulator [Gammaproteobacteria bacterium]|jgi:CheY-like chemotaxis protein|nr:response regulator [Gammaproteobacteria bacterium]MBT4606321.1 response regulator [Thiotrichales bacterium]MBT3473732.1 response regulator [Gammaproteobacteria bacterium]MBT3968447.1 response regulator [Gammaproteobacteria bacterium]MBT4081749.1 response regulator [Gammaproteobacteria bacterium]